MTTVRKGHKLSQQRSLLDEGELATKVEKDPSMGAHQLAQPRPKRSRHVLLVASALCILLLLLWLRCRYFSTRHLSFVGQMYHEQGNENMTLVILPQALADIKGAYCLDRSPPSFYIRKAKDTKTQRSWFVTLQGGGWCWNASDCYNRSLSSLGSSYLLPKEIQFNGTMSANSTVNPEFYDWNMVMINYCDGASFSGNLESPVSYNNTYIYYRGYRVLNLVLAYLLERVGLAEAERIILGGVSAGGLAVYLHVDHIRSILPASIPVHGMVDAGFFLDERNVSGYEHYRIHMVEIFNMQNASGSLNKACLAATDGKYKWKCFFAEYTYPYISSAPLFIINSAYDYWQQWFILDLRCHPLQCPDKIKYLTRHHTIFMQEIDQVYRHPDDGMFISSCYAHSQVFHDDTWMTYKVGGKTTRQAFGDWYFGRTTPAESRYVDCSPYYDCNPSCKKSWTLPFYKNVTNRMKTSTPDF